MWARQDFQQPFSSFLQKEEKEKMLF